MKIRLSLNLAQITTAGTCVLLTLIAFGCIKTPLEPIMPASDIQMSIPILDRTRTVADLFGKDTSKVKQNAAGYYYEDDRSFSPAKLDTIKVTPKASINQAVLGQLTVPGLPAQNTTVTAGQMGLGNVNYPGSPAPPFPAADFSVKGVALQDSAEFDYLQVFSGSMSLTVTNNLALDVTFEPIVLRNNKTTTPTDNSVLASFNIGTVVSGQSKTVTVSLASELMRGALQTDSIKMSTAQRSTPFTVNSTDNISFGFGTSSLVVDSASAKIPQQNLVSVNDSTITLDSTAVLQQALFSAGNFSLNVNNQSGLLVGARLKFSNFVKSIAPFDTLSFDTTVAGHTNFSFPVNLANYRVVNGTQGAFGGTSLRFSIGIRSVNSLGAKLSVTSRDFVQASFNPLQQFVVKSLTGVMNPMTVPVNTSVSLAGLGDASNKFSGSLSYDSIQIVLKFGLSSGFPISHNLTLVTINRKVVPIKIDSLKIPSGIIHPGLNTPGTITLGNAQGLSAFLGTATSSLPDSMYVRGSVVVNPPAPISGTIYDTTKIYPSMSVIIPMKLGLLGGQYVDVAAISGKFDSAFVASTKSGTMYFSIENGLPLALSFKANFIGRKSAQPFNRDTLLRTPQLPLYSTYSIAGANVDASGSVTSAKTSIFNISLVTQEIQALSASDSVYIRVSLNTSGTQGPPAQAVRIRATDYIRIRASANAVYTVNKK